MELRHLRYFVAAAEDGSFRRAAQRLNISEPALGAQIRELERESGVLLFERLPRGVRLNAAGRAFLSDARRLLGDLKQAIEYAHRVGQGAAGVLRVGHVPSAMPRPLGMGRLIPTFCARYPKVDVKALELPAADHAAALNDERIDVGIAYAPPPKGSGLKSEMVEDNFLTGVLLPSNHPLAKRHPLHCRDLAFLPHIRAPRGLYSYADDFLAQEMRARGLDMLNSDSEVSDVSLRVGLVAIGVGWMVSSEKGHGMVANTQGVVYREWAEPPIHYPCFAVWLNDNALIANFISVARELRDSEPGKPDEHAIGA